MPAELEQDKDEMLQAMAAPMPRKKLEDVEMDITPMIDITFLLLIFFLVCSTPDQDTAIEMAKARYGRGVGERNSVIITISSSPIWIASSTLLICSEEICEM